MRIWVHLQKRRQVCKEIYRILRNQIFHCNLHKGLPLEHMPSEINPVNTFLPYHNNIYFDIILPSVPISSKWTLPFKYSDHTLYAFLDSPMRPYYGFSVCSVFTVTYLKKIISSKGVVSNPVFDYFWFLKYSSKFTNRSMNYYKVISVAEHVARSKKWLCKESS
jgi:hypothetical protein